MKTLLRTLCLVLLVLPCRAWAADKAKEGTPSKLTLEDVIFEPTYLTKLLGSKSLIVPAEDRAGLTPELAKVLDQAGVTAQSRVFLLPDGASPPILKSSLPYAYPKSLRQGKEKGKARFLVLVGADGAVKTLHCYEHTDRMFALAVAVSVVRWKYVPTKIAGTAVPVILDFPAEFRGDGYENEFAGWAERDPTANAPRQLKDARP